MINNSFEKTNTQYPSFGDIHDLIHARIYSVNSEIEDYRKKGLLAEAFELELYNPGKMLRNIAFYLRQPIGSTYPIKVNTKDLNVKPKNKILVKTDIQDILQTDKFAKAIKGANPKLLSHAKTVLSDPFFSTGGVVEKIMFGTLIRYEEPLLRVQEEWLDSVFDAIDTEYKRNRRANNKKLGKVFVSEHMKNIPVLHSGKIDAGKSTSGKYLPVGSKIKLDLGANRLIRFGVSWKSKKDKKLSICIDPSVTIMDGKLQGRVVNYQSPTLDNIVNSSGDITQCNTYSWSTELMDIDTTKLLKRNSSKFYTTVINYSHPTGSLSDVECHIFFNVIDRNDRVISGRKIEIPLEKMQHSYEITEDIPAQIGLLFDIQNGECEVLKIPVENIYSSSNANGLRNTLDSLVYTKPQITFSYNEILNCLDAEQIVDNVEEADLVLDNNTDASLIQSILF